MFRVDSEVGDLREVIVHRPGSELGRLTPHNVDDLLFDDIMWAERAREEHDAFVEQMTRRGIVVHRFASCSLRRSTSRARGSSCRTG